MLRGVWLTARRFFALCAREKRWSICMAIFVLAWTIELFLVQAATLVYPNVPGVNFAFWAPKIRFVIDLLFVLSLTFWLRRRWLCIIVAVSFCSYLILITYFQYFSRPLSLLIIVHNWREGLTVGGFALDLFPKRAVALLLLASGIQWAALVASRKVSLPRRCAWLGGTVTAAMFTGLYLVAGVLDPLSYVQTTRGVGRLGEIRGYLGPWFAEWYYLGDREVLARALELRELSKTSYNRLTPIEADIPIHKRLVIIQAESFDTNILDYKVNGREVTPFLNALRKRSMYYRVRAMHLNASADADFATLTGVRGSDHETPYAIPGYPYDDSTPQLLAECGFETTIFHGLSGDFYNRRGPLNKMGFKEICFQEEMEGRYGLRGDRWGVRDTDALTLSALKLREATSPACHVMMTVTTHTPYTLLRPNEQEIFIPPRTTGERYINNMRHLDNCLRDYITSLGRGTTVFIYADHPTENMDGFKPDRQGALKYIPCLIYDSDEDLSKVQKTRDNPISTNGQLNQVDVVRYLRDQLTRQFKKPTP
jgi:hypothetical protein